MKLESKNFSRAHVYTFIITIIILGFSAISGSSFTRGFARPFEAAIPSVSISTSSVMIGENFSFTITFENTGSDPGYGPFIDLVFPLTGQDGDDGIDYISASYLGSALDDDVQIFPDDGSGSGCVSHPWLRDITGAYVDVCGPAGDKFVSLMLPFGSYVPGQPPLDITVNASLSINADLTPDLIIYARGGYIFGETPEDDWCCGDAPFAIPSGTNSSTWPPTPISPQVFSFEKTYTGPGNTQDETATGPNFPRQYSLTIDIASGQTLSNIEIQDQLPDNLQFIGINPGTTGGYTITSLPSTTEPGGTLSLNYASGSGSINMVFDFYIPELYDQNGDTLFDDPVINPTSGNDVNSDNIAWVNASWDPFDTRDPITPITSDATCPTCPPLHTLQDKSIAIQKDVQVVAGTGGGSGLDQAAPGAILEYTLVFQISDYFSFDSINITDTISDGQHVLQAATHQPTLQVNGNSYALGTAAFNSANYSVDCDYSGATTTPPTECTVVSGDASGGTTLTFDISAEIITRSQNGTMLGGCVDPAGGVYSPCDPSNLNDGPTTATLIFRTQVLDQFVDDYPSGDISVDQGDELDNTAVVSGDVLNNITFAVIGSESDNATAGTAIGRESLSKSIYAINNDPIPSNWVYDSLGRIRIKPGDKITYRLTYGLLTSDVEELSFDDYFPLPVFHVNDPDENGAPGPTWSFSDAGGIPDPGIVTLLLTGDTFYQYMTDGLSGGTGVLSPSTNNPTPPDITPTQAPVITSDVDANKINIYYADYDDTRNQSTTVDLLFSLIVANDPFADGLFLTNMAHAFEGSTNAGTSTDDAIIQFVLNEPVLVSSKGIVYTDNINAVFDPVDVGPGSVAFLAPGHPSVPPRWTGTINSNGLDANPINSDLSGVDAGDTLTFAITIENTGNSINGAFDIQLRDILDTAFYQIPATGLNLQIFYGDGTGPIPYQAVDTSCTVDPGANNDFCGEEIFEEGLELIDPVGAGVCSVHDPNNGNNVILITYDLEIIDDVIPGDAVNTVSLINYAGSEGGPNHLPQPQEDDATASVIAGLEKTLEGTEIVSGTNADNEVVIGEIVTYKLSVIVPEGEVPGARLIDQLDGGLAFISCDAAVILNPVVSAGISTNFGSGSTTDFSTVCGITEASGVTNSGQTIEFDLGDLVNSDRVNTTEERIEITYQVVVLNFSGNQAGVALDNAADFLMDDGSGDIVVAFNDAPDVTVIEPQVNTTKVSSIGTADAGDAFTYTITFTNPNNPADTDAFEVEFLDNFPLCPVPTDGSAVLNLTLDTQSGPATFVLSEIGGDGNANGWQLTTAAIDMAPGDTTTVDISGTIAYCVNPGLSLENTGTTTWTSLDGDFTTTNGAVPVPRSSYNTSSVERTGADGVGGPLNDYANGGTAAIQIDNAVNTKYIISTSETHTELVNGLENLAIGEIVRFRLVSAIPESTSPNFQVRDFLPDGLVFLNDNTAVVAFVSTGGITSTSVGSLPVPAIPDICNQVGSAADAGNPVMDMVNCTLSNSNLGSSSSIVSDLDTYTPGGTDVWFKLGSLVNNDSDLDTEYVVIEFNALVHNGNSTALQNDAGDIWSNQHQIFINSTANGNPSNTAQIRISEPVITVTKTLVVPGPVDAGDPMVYDITFSNSSAGDSSATAYELVLSDTFDAYLENLSITSVTSSQGDWTNPGIICDGDGSGTTDFDVTPSLIGDSLAINVSCLDAGENVTVRISGDVVDSVPAGVTIPNTAAGIATSLEGPNGTTGNLTGSDTPGTSGTDNGERDGSDTDTGGQDDHYDTGVLDHSLQAPLIDKYVEAPAEFTIGDTFTYDLVVTLPDGLTPDMVVYDNLPLGLEYVSYNIITTAAAAGSRLTLNFDGTLPAPVATVIGGSGGDFDLVFGDTTTNPEYPNNINNNRFQVQITVRMLNESGNQNGDILTNQGELRYSSGVTATGTVDIEVIEPVLEIDKSVDDDSAALDQNITFTLRIAHDLDGVGEDSQSDAYDVQIDDSLPTGLSNIANLNVNSTGNCATGIDTSGSTTSVIDINIASIPHMPPAPGCIVTITFDATVDSPPDPNTPSLGDVINNTGEITWTSLSGPDGNERFGDGVSGGLNDYEDNDSQAVTITNPELQVSKDDGVVFYIPGLTVVYDIVVENVGNGDVTGAIVSDDIPSQVSTWTWVCAGSTGTASGCDGVVGSGTNFTDTVNLGANSSITYQVTANIPSSSSGDMTNTVSVAMPAGVVEPTPANNTASDTDVQQSHADLRISKDDGVTITSPGQTLTYTVLVENTSPSDVFGAEVTDSRPANILNWIWTCTGSTGGASGCTPAANSVADFSDFIDLPAGSSITYTVTAQVSPLASGTITNIVLVAVPAGVTEDDLSNNSDDDIDGIAEHTKLLDSQVHGVTVLPDVAIGEIVAYEITLEVPQGSMPNLTLLDILDQGLAFVDCVSITGTGLTVVGPADLADVCANPAILTYPGGSSDTEDLGRQIEFDFGTLNNSSGGIVDLVLLYRVVVLDSLENQSDSTPPLNNQAVWTWDSGTLSDQAVGVLILEPDLFLTKGVDRQVIYPGQIRTFTITLGHTGDSQTSAFNVEITDIIPVELDYQPVIRHISGPVPSEMNDSNNPTLYIRWDEFPNTGTPAVFEIDVMLESSITQLKREQRITNDASVSWTSLLGDFSTPQSPHNPLSTERFYDPLSNINIYGTSDGITVRVPALPDTGFAPGKITPLPIQSEDLIYGDLDDLRVEIPDLGISLPIVSVPQSDQGWDLTWLWNQAGWLEGTAYPSWYGNTVITGHAYLSNGLPGPFVDLEKLSWGDEIILFAHGLKYTYQVRIRDLVSAYDLSILGHKDQDWLTLFTCQEYNEITDQYNWRQVIQAVLIDVEEIQ